MGRDKTGVHYSRLRAVPKPGSIIRDCITIKFTKQKRSSSAADFWCSPNSEPGSPNPESFFICSKVCFLFCDRTGVDYSWQNRGRTFSARRFFFPKGVKTELWIPLSLRFRFSSWQQHFWRNAHRNKRIPMGLNVNEFVKTPSKYVLKQS